MVIRRYFIEHTQSEAQRDEEPTEKKKRSTGDNIIITNNQQKGGHSPPLGEHSMRQPLGTLAPMAFPSHPQIPPRYRIRQTDPGTVREKGTEQQKVQNMDDDTYIRLEKI